MGRRELREHIFRLLFRRDFFPEEEMKEQEAFYIEYLADPEQKEAVSYTHLDVYKRQALESMPKAQAANS